MEHDSEVIQEHKNFFKKMQSRFLTHKRLWIFIGVICVVAFIGWKYLGPKKSSENIQTATVEPETIISSVSESGSVSVANRSSVTTQASGVIAEVDVKNGDTVTPGQQIAKINLDLNGQQAQAQAWASYLSAKSSLDSANATMYTLQSSMYAAWQNYTNLAENSTYQNSDGTPNIANRTLPQFTTVQDTWLAAEAQYKNQQGVIAQDQAVLTSSWLSYQKNAAIVTAPSGGVITDITIVPGMQIAGASSSNSTTGSSANTSSQTIAAIKNDGSPVVSVSLSEIDAAKVQTGQKSTVTFDALPAQTFSGKVMGINTTGQVSSGVTTYPATIQLDVPNDKILPNMSATASIIINVKADVLGIPSSAIQNNNGQATVRVMRNNQIVSVPVETGVEGDTDTEITSGLSEGDTVVTSIITPASSANGATSSPFGAGLRAGGFGGAGGGRAFTQGGGR